MVGIDCAALALPERLLCPVGLSFPVCLCVSSVVATSLRCSMQVKKDRSADPCQCRRLDEEEYGGYQLLLMEGLMPAIGLFLVRAQAAAEGLCHCPGARPMPWRRWGCSGPGGIRASLFTGCLLAVALSAAARGKDMQLAMLLLQCSIHAFSKAPGSCALFTIRRCSLLRQAACRSA